MAVELGGNIYPYIEEDFPNNKRIRTFPAEVWPEDLVWHRDESDRWIEVISSNGWQLQFDNELPVELVMGERYFIPKEHFHRVIKGQGELIVSIQE